MEEHSNHRIAPVKWIISLTKVHYKLNSKDSARRQKPQPKRRMLLNVVAVKIPQQIEPYHVLANLAKI